MNPRRSLSKLLLMVALGCMAVGRASAEELRVGYWTSGISLGFGAVLEAQKFFQKRGLQVTFMHFPDVNGPTTALASGAIDLAFGTSLAGGFSLAQQGVKVRLVAATQIVDAEIVVPADSPVRTPADLRGKKVGMSPLGSATAGVGTAVLDGNYGLKLSDYRLIGADEPRLAQFLLQKDVDAAIIRPTTVAQIADSTHKLRVLGTLADEWKRMTKSSTPPYIGAAVMSDSWIKAHPADTDKVLAAMRDALAFGKSHPDQVVKILEKAGNMSEQGARFYADHWTGMNTVSLSDDDIATLKRTFEVFKAAGTMHGDLPDSLFDQQPWLDVEAAK